MKLIVSNHKMNLTKEEILSYVKELSAIKSSNKLVFCPSYPYFTFFDGNNYILGSQDVSDQEVGAYTGEVSAKQLKSLGIEYTIVGHSERRTILNESLETIHKKVNRCLENDIIPILCIGETKEEIHKKEEILSMEIKSAFDNLNDNRENIIIAYEPIWSIGTGLVPTIEEIEKTLSWIKNYIKEHYQVECKTLYGGSVNEENISNLKKVQDIDGYLIGGTSLKLNNLKRIIDILEV